MPQPILAYLTDRGIRQTWLARRIGRTPEYVNRVLHGVYAGSPEFRAACAAALQVDESVLFHDASSASASEDADGSNDGAGVAVARAYSIAVEVGVAKST